MEIEIEHLKTNENVVIMRLKDYKRLKESTNSFYKCWREDEKRIDKAIKFLKENASYDYGDFSRDLIYYDCRQLLDILKGSDTNE